MRKSAPPMRSPVARGLRQRNLTARLFRTSALIADTQNDSGLRRMSLASADFGQSQPGTRPLAATDLLRADELNRSGSPVDALAQCRRAVGLLRDLKVGTTTELMAPCLRIYAAGADRDPSQRQTLLGEMFLASQLVQGSITSQQIALASARLTAGAKDPRVGLAIRRQQDAGNALAELERQRDAATTPALRDPPAPPCPRSADELAHNLTEARATLADADAALQTAAPQYAQLVQEVVPAADVLAALRPGEVFASITLTAGGGWVFVLRDGQVDAAPAGTDLPGVTAMVKRNPDEHRAGARPAAAVRHRRRGRTVFRHTRPSATPAGRRACADRGAGRAAAVAALQPAAHRSRPIRAHSPPRRGWYGRWPISHVSAAGLISSRCARHPAIARAGQPWFGFGDFRPGHPAAGPSAPSPVAPARTAPSCSPACPPCPSPRRELDATRALLGGSRA